MTLEEVLAEMVRLASAGGAGIGVVLLVLLVGAVLVVLRRHLKLPQPRPEEPPPESEWNTDPERGAVVVPGPPGGHEEQNQNG